VRTDGEIWNFFTMVPDLTDLIPRTDRLLLALIVGCRTVWVKWYRLFKLSACRYVLKSISKVSQQQKKLI